MFFEIKKQYTEFKTVLNSVLKKKIPVKKNIHMFKTLKRLKEKKNKFIFFPFSIFCKINFIFLNFLNTKKKIKFNLLTIYNFIKIKYFNFYKINFIFAYLQFYKKFKICENKRRNKTIFFFFFKFFKKKN